MLSSLSQAPSGHGITGEFLNCSGRAAAAASIEASVTSAGSSAIVPPLRGAGQGPDRSQAAVPLGRVGGGVADRPQPGPPHSGDGGGGKREVLGAELYLGAQLPAGGRRGKRSGGQAGQRALDGGGQVLPDARGGPEPGGEARQRLLGDDLLGLRGIPAGLRAGGLVAGYQQHGNAERGGQVRVDRPLT